MRIISPYYDFYDMFASADDTCIWKRQTTVLKFQANLQPRQRYMLTNTAPSVVSNETLDFFFASLHRLKHDFQHLPEISVGILGFCGRVEPLLIFSAEPVPSLDVAKAPFETYYTGLKFFAALSEAQRQQFFNNIPRYFRPAKTHGSVEKYVEKFSDWQPKHQTRTDFTDFFRAFQTPCFFVSLSTATDRFLPESGARETLSIYSNINLGRFQFQKQLEPWLTFQALELYLTNELTQEHQVPLEISDKMKRDKHGFDQHSFKKTKAMSDSTAPKKTAND